MDELKIKIAVDADALEQLPADADRSAKAATASFDKGAKATSEAFRRMGKVHRGESEEMAETAAKVGAQQAEAAQKAANDSTKAYANMAGAFRRAADEQVVAIAKVRDSNGRFISQGSQGADAAGKANAGQKASWLSVSGAIGLASKAASSYAGQMASMQTVSTIISGIGEAIEGQYRRANELADSFIATAGRSESRRVRPARPSMRLPLEVRRLDSVLGQAGAGQPVRDDQAGRRDCGQGQSLGNDRGAGRGLPVSRVWGRGIQGAEQSEDQHHPEHDFQHSKPGVGEPTSPDRWSGRAVGPLGLLGDPIRQIGLCHDFDPRFGSTRHAMILGCRAHPGKMTMGSNQEGNAIMADRLDPIQHFGFTPGQAEAVLRGRLDHYRAVRFHVRRLIRLRGLIPAVAAARAVEQSEASIESRGGSLRMRTWMMSTVRAAAEDERDGRTQDLDGQPFDPGQLQWQAYLDERGLDDDTAGPLAAIA